MTVAELRERIAQWENLHTDFKERFESDRELAKDLVCFANTDGGQLIFGIAKDRTITGIEDPDKLSAKVDNVAFQHCEPPITIVQEVLNLDGKNVVVVNIPKGDQRPYRTNYGNYYVRTTTDCRQASREELLRLFQATQSLYYDESPLPRLTLADLNLDALDRYLEVSGQADAGIDRERLLKNWGLLSRGHPTVAGLLLLGHEPQRHLPYTQINAARFPGTDSSSEPVDRKDLNGRILDIIDQAERFLDLHLRSNHEIRGFEPETKPELPKEALREAIVNAVAHRDYTVKGPIRLFVFNDRIDLHTPGKPPNTVDADAMRAGVHVLRNPWIYARLYDAGLVTGAGTGVRRMVRLIREVTGRDVDIAVRDFEVVITIPRNAEPQRNLSIELSLRSVAYSTDFRGVVLVADLRNPTPNSDQVTDWTLEIPSSQFLSRGRPGPAPLVPEAPWWPPAPFDIEAKKMTRGSLFFPGDPTWKEGLPEEPLRGRVTARLFLSKPLEQDVEIYTIRTLRERGSPESIPEPNS